MKIKSNRIKVLFLLIGIAMFASINAQDNVPLGLRYQAVARDDEGKPMIKRDIVAKMQIVQIDKDVLIWEELHYTTTNEFGLFQLIIGQGFTTGEGMVLDFESINWRKASLALQVELDFGKGFLNMGITMLQSVPYAFLADSALNAPLPDMELGQLENVSSQKPTKNQPLVWNGKKWLPGDSLKVKNLLIQDALKIGDSGPIIGVIADSNLSDASDQTIPTSKAVKSYVDDAGADADTDPLNELQDLQLDSGTLIITGISNPTEINLSPYQGVDTDKQNLSLDGTLLKIERGDDVDLSPIQDGTEDADADPNNEIQDLQLESNILTITGNSSATPIDLSSLPDEVDDLDPDPANELQDLSLAGTDLSISDGSTIDLSIINTDDQNLTLTDHLLTIEGGNSITLPDNVNDNDADPANELQDLSLAGKNLSISDGSTIDLSIIDSDNQNLILADHLLTIEGGNSITLPDNVNDNDADSSNELQLLSITGNTLAISNGNSIDIPSAGTDADADSTNEIQDLLLVGTNLSITRNSNATLVDLSPYQGTNTDNQKLTLSGTQLSIERGNTVDLSSLPDEVDDLDPDPANELQDLSLVGTELSISDGNTIDLSIIDTDTRLTEPEVDAFVANNGYLSTESDPIFTGHPANNS